MYVLCLELDHKLFKNRRHVLVPLDPTMIHFWPQNTVFKKMFQYISFDFRT